jgi:hypothetical protein
MVVATPAFGACNVMFVTDRLLPAAVTVMVAPLAGEVVTSTSLTPPQSLRVRAVVVAVALLHVTTPSKKEAEVSRNAVCEADADVGNVVGEVVPLSGA